MLTKLSEHFEFRHFRPHYLDVDTIFGDLKHECLHQRVVRNTIFRKAPPSVVSGYGKRSINLNKVVTAGNRHKQNSWFCKEIRENNFRFWWRRVHEDASQGMYMSKIEIFFFTARILQNQRMLCCGECFHD
jgi:hypothetical protein